MKLFRRLGALIVTIWLAATIVFLALRLLPGDALQAQLAMSGANQEIIAARLATQGLSDSLPVQYLRFVAGLLRGDLGASLISGEPVSDALLRTIPATLNLAFGALLVALVLGLTLGIISVLDMPVVSGLARLVTGLALSVPIYWTGIIAIYLFSVRLELLPAGGAGGISHLLLPMSILGFHSSAAIARLTNASISEVLSADYIRTARSKGLTASSVFVHHLLPVAMLPVITVAALQAGFLLSGAVVTETIFVRPGLGRLLLDATIKQDYPIVQGVVVVSTAAYAVTNLVADMLQTALDPRIALSQR